MLKNAEHLFVEPILFQPVFIIERRLSTPAYEERGIYIGSTPFKNAAQLVPIVNLFKLHIFNGSTCNHHAVKAFALYIFKDLVKLEHMLFGNIFRFMRSGLEQLRLDLNRRIAQQTQYLRLCLDLRRHQIENEYFQRAYVLRHSPFLGHNENIFIFQQLVCRQITVYFYRHDFLPFTSCV